MTREEALLREACARAAQEEADQLERQLTDGESREAEALFARHRKEAFQVIARHTAAPSSRRWSKALRAAACLLILGAGVFAAPAHVPAIPGNAALRPALPLRGPLLHAENRRGPFGYGRSGFRAHRSAK